MLFGRKKTTGEAFWTWFQKANLLEASGGDFVEKVGPKLAEYHDGVVCEVGPGDQRPREFIISADGLREHVDAVESLADAAPSLQDWKVTRFRPRMADYEAWGLRYDDTQIDPASMKFVAKRNDTLVDICLFVPWGDNPERRPDNAAFIMLDIALGEYDVMCRVGHVEMHPLENAREDARPWKELRTVFDELSAQ